MAQRPSIPKGTRDFNPEQVAKRNYIFDVIRKQFETFGFQPIETPSFENSETLMGKYGEEGDRLIFKILNSGDYLEKLTNILTVFFQEYFQYVITYYIVYETVVTDSLAKDIQKHKNSKGYRNKLKEHKINDAQEHQFLDENFDSSANAVLIRNKKEIASIILKYKGKKNVEKFDDEDSLKIVNLSVEAIGFWFLKYTNRKFDSHISEKALRYDLTVPFARYVAQHQNEIEFPFKRYQIQPVWRADRPQKGRFREFYQCDADVVGSKSLWQEVEFVQLYDAVFSTLNLEGVTIKINNRKILYGIAEVIGAQEKLIDFTVALDKLDKIGEEKVKEDMLNKGIPQSGIDKLQPLFSLSGSFESQIKQLKTILTTSEEGLKGIEELEFIDKAISELQLQTATLQLDVTLARGLNYYTGAIFEVSAPESVKMGSIGGGGRYDDLTGIFGLPNVSGVGISFGLDRIYLVLEELGLFPETISNTVKVLFINFGESEAFACLKAIKALRENGISAELYPDTAKMKKQMNYANKRQIPFVVLVGEEELKTNRYTLKDMTSGNQEKLTLQELTNQLQ